MKRYNPKGFTLIELLIVVAIIAILAAIAVPNFLEAQTRAKVSRAMTDIRTCGQAIDIYMVDWNFVPYLGDVAPGFLGSAEYLQWKELNDEDFGIGRVLTSPVAYLNSIPEDYFNSSVNAFQMTPRGAVRVSDVISASFYYRGAKPGAEQFFTFTPGFWPSAYAGRRYLYRLSSIGPDLRAHNGTGGLSEGQHPFHNPTN